MARRDILLLPDPALRRRSAPVTVVDDEVRALVADMFEAMYEAPGIGLAAIQVGVPLRVVTMDLAPKEGPPAPRIFINPEIVWVSEERGVYQEGCLSIPDYFEEVERPARVRLRFLDETGKAREEEADGLFATCIQHEIDHLDGVLFIDHLSRLKRARVLRKFAKAAKREAD